MKTKKTNYNVLIVDDDPEVIKWLRLTLEQKGLRTYAAFDAFSALYLCKEIRPDMIILDLHLGNHKIQGTEVLWSIKNDPEISSTVILIFTGCRDEEVEKLCMDEIGADGYLIKGEAHKIDLAAAIQTWLRKIHLGNAQELVTGPLRINLAQGQAYLHQKPLPLTPKEFNLLAYTVKRSPNLAEWNMLGRKILRGSQAVESCLAHLKSKLGDTAWRLLADPGTGVAWAGESCYLSD